MCAIRNGNALPGCRSSQFIPSAMHLLGSRITESIARDANAMVNCNCYEYVELMLLFGLSAIAYG